jgi:plastocyanin
MSYDRSHKAALAIPLCIAITAGFMLAPVRAVEPGRIVGHIRLGSRPVRRPLVSSAYAPRQIAVPAPPAPELSNVLVWIKDAAWSGPLPVTQDEIEQRDEMFVPHVVPITVGSTVKFPNRDPFFHNVFSLSRTASFDLGRYPRDGSRTQTFDRPGIVKVFCHIHSHMSALVAVFDHPYFARVSPDGSFTIDHVPAGTHTLTAWHERAGDTTSPVKVEPGDTAHIEMVVPIVES